MAIKPLKEWTVKELYDLSLKCNFEEKRIGKEHLPCDRCPFRGDTDFCDMMAALSDIGTYNLEIYKEVEE